MANILNVADAINRVRTILDRGNSPWMSDAEINDFISMAANEFIQERVDKFGATQKIRDDLGDFVQTMCFTKVNPSIQPVSGTIGISEYNYNGSPLLWINQNAETDSGTNVYNISENIGPISPIACVVKQPDFIYNNNNQEYNYGGEINSSYIIRVNLVTVDYDTTDEVINRVDYQDCKIISLDDLQVAASDPFNSPDEDNVRAVKVGNAYYITPHYDIYPFHSDGSIKLIVFEYVLDDYDVNKVVDFLPKHSIEEICQIAARKILGTTADERYQVGTSEIQQLDNK